MKNFKGFTLIETIIYLGLFAIVIGGGMIAAYSIIQGTDANNNQVIVQEEGNFLLRKLDWALTGATAVTVPNQDTTLNVTKGGATLIFDLSGGNLTLDRGSGAAQLNTSSSAITLTPSSHLFTKTVTAGEPDAITANFTISSVSAGRTFSQSFTTTRYLRQ